MKSISLVFKFSFPLVMFLLLIGSSLEAQNLQSYSKQDTEQKLKTGKYPMNKTVLSPGLTAGTFLFFNTYELSVLVNRRVSPLLVLEVKPVAGLVKQTFNPDLSDAYISHREEKYKFLYFGGSGGILLGKTKHFLEINAGAAYVYDLRDNERMGFGLIGSTGYRLALPNITFRAGLGWPYGAYASFHF